MPDFSREEVERVAKGLSASMLHVMGRCSLVERWERDGRTFTRQWPDIVAGRSRTSFQTIHALVRRGVLYEDSHRTFGLTDFGVRVWLCRPRQHLIGTGEGGRDGR